MLRGNVLIDEVGKPAWSWPFIEARRPEVHAELALRLSGKFHGEDGVESHFHEGLVGIDLLGRKIEQVSEQESQPIEYRPGGRRYGARELRFCNPGFNVWRGAVTRLLHERAEAADRGGIIEAGRRQGYGKGLLQLAGDLDSENGVDAEFG